MIPFTMNILGYKSGTYSVEYVPNNSVCKPIKLSIQLDQQSLTDKDQIINRLKLSSPQEYWYNQVLAEEATVDEVLHRPINPIRARGEAVTSPTPAGGVAPDLPPSTAAYMGRPVNAPVGSRIGSSTPEQVASHQEQNIIMAVVI